MRHEVRKTVINTISDRMNIDKDRIEDNTDLRLHLLADSLDLAELMMDLEDAFTIKITDEEYEKMKTVKDIVEFIKKVY